MKKSIKNTLLCERYSHYINDLHQWISFLEEISYKSSQLAISSKNEENNEMLFKTEELLIYFSKIDERFTHEFFKIKSTTVKQDETELSNYFTKAFHFMIKFKNFSIKKIENKELDTITPQDKYISNAKELIKITEEEITRARSLYSEKNILSCL